MNVEIGAEAALFPGKEYIIGIAVAVHAQDISVSGRHSLGAGKKWRFHAIRHKTQRSQVFIADINK
jgi:hypothetical protein